MSSKKKRFYFIRQLDQMDCGPTCLRMISRHYGKSYTAQFFKDNSHLSRGGTSFAGLSEAAEIIGMHTVGVNADIDTLINKVPLPCIAHWKQRHFVVVHNVDKKFIHIADPGYGLVKYTHMEFDLAWRGGNDNGVLLLLEPTPIFYSQTADNSDPSSRSNMRFFTRYLRPHNKLLIQVIYGLIVTSIIQLCIPFLTQSIVDYGINYKNPSFISLILIAQLMLVLSSLIIEGVRSWLILHITTRMNLSLIIDYLIKLMKLPISFFDSKNTGDLLQRIQDNNRIQSFLSTQTISVIFSIFNVVVFGCILAFYDLIIFSIFLGGSILYVIWVLLFLKKRAELDFKRFDQASGNQSSMIQLIQGMQEIKLNNSEIKRRWEYEEMQSKLLKVSISSLKLGQFQNLGGILLNESKNILITFIAAKAVLDGQLSLGMMLSIQYIVGQLNVPISNFISFIQSWQDAKLSIQRLSEIQDRKEELIKDIYYYNKKTIEISIRFTNVNFRYGNKSGDYVLKNIDIEIPSGKVTAIVGASGSGKTTLLKLLLKFYEPETGSIEVDNIKLQNIHPISWRQNCGVVMQDGYIFSDSIFRNIAESEKIAMDAEKVFEAGRLANIHEYIETLPLGYNTRIGPSGISLSGGQHQRILIARAIYKEPQILIMDEATSSLDAKNEKVIIQNLESFYKDKTVVVVAHRLSTVQHADQIIVMDEGSVVESGDHKSLINSKGAYYELIKNQLELGK